MSAFPAGSSRLLPIDVLKALAAQLIVWHHALLYGPLATAAEAATPQLAAWLQRYGRFAVQAFLVAGGFLALRGLLSKPVPLSQLLLRRHARIALPFAAAVLLTLGAHSLTADLLPELLPQAVEAGNLLAHLLLLHGVLGQESLTVGAWYVAIDFQLYALLALLVLLARRGLPLTVLLSALVLASAWGFNRFSSGDSWAPYFFAAYGLGALAALPGGRHRTGLLLVATAVALALLVDFRGRLLLALILALGLNGLAKYRLPQPLAAASAWFSDRSYALFLSHFAVLLLGNALFRLAGGEVDDGQAAWLMLVGCWLTAQAAAHVFLLRIERPLARWDPLAALHQLRQQPLRLWPLLPLAGAGFGLELLAELR
jgi:peptidoglycan/LPS O-acetylase OafA/YrhL